MIPVDVFAQLKNIIEERRSIKPDIFTGQIIPDEQVKALLELAFWAPTHGRTEPWFFNVFSGEKTQEFCQHHAEMYKANTDPEKFLQPTYDRFATMGDKASHIIVACMKRGTLPQIPEFEEIIAASCATQNILLGATALGIASFWSTGGQTLKPAMKDYLKLDETDAVLGIIYLGYGTSSIIGKRLSSIETKVKWH